MTKDEKQRREKFLYYMRKKGSASRADVEREMDFNSKSALMRFLNKMERCHIIEEVDLRTKPNKTLRYESIRLNTTYFFVIGVYVSENRVSVGLGTLSAAVMERKNVTIKNRCSMAEIAAVIRTAASMLIQNCCLKRSRIIGVGVGIEPEMAKRLCDKSTANSAEYTFYGFSQAIGQGLRMPVCIADSSAQIAGAAVNFDMTLHHPPKNVSCLFLKDGSRHISAVQDYDLRKDLFWHTNAVDHIIVSTGGRCCEGQLRGSVRAELSPDAIAHKLTERKLFSMQQTPALYQLCGGDSQAVTIEQVMAAVDKGDEALIPLREELLNEFCMLLLNIRTIFRSEIVMLVNFDFADKHMRQIRAYLGQYGLSESEQDCFRLCRMEEGYEFICAAQYAVNECFYKVGGIVPAELLEDADADSEDDME